MSKKRQKQKGEPVRTSQPDEPGEEGPTVLATCIVQNEQEGRRNMSRGIELELPRQVVELYTKRVYHPNIDSATLDHLATALERSIREQKAGKQVVRAIREQREGRR